MLAISNCNLKRIEKNTAPQQATNYSTFLCSWLKPYYGIKGNFEDNLPEEVLRLMLRSDAEYDSVCLIQIKELDNVN